MENIWPAIFSGTPENFLNYQNIIFTKMFRIFWFIEIIMNLTFKLFPSFSILYSDDCDSTKKPYKRKSILFFDNCPCLVFMTNLVLVWFECCTSYLSRKKGIRNHFSASAYGLGFRNFSLGSLFSTSVTWTTLQSDEDKNLSSDLAAQLWKQNTNCYSYKV